MADLDPRSDHDLVRAANSGDQDAFEALYLRYRDYVVRLAYRFTGNRHDALDVLQDAFTYLLSKLPRLRLTSRMTTFLYPVVRSLSISMRRKRRPDFQSDGMLRNLPAPPAEAHGASRAELASVLSALPAEQLETVLMRFVDEMSLAEIAEALAIPLGTVQSRLSKAIRKLRDDPRTRRYFLE